MNKSIVYSKKFKSHYKRRIRNKSKLKRIFIEKLSLFKQSSEHPSLKNHFLKHKKRDLRGLKSFSITNDIRVLYKENDEYYLFIDIGTHKEVYGEGLD